MLPESLDGVLVYGDKENWILRENSYGSNVVTRNSTVNLRSERLLPKSGVLDVLAIHSIFQGRKGEYHCHEREITETVEDSKHECSLGPESEERTFIISNDVPLPRCFGRNDFVVEAVGTADDIAHQDSHGKPDDQNERYARVEIIGDEGGFQSPDGSVQDH